MNMLSNTCEKVPICNKNIFGLQKCTYVLTASAKAEESPNGWCVIEELIWTERIKKKEFYLDVKSSLLNLLEFSEIKNDTTIG